MALISVELYSCVHTSREMITKIKVQFAVDLTEKLGVGPLKTVVYSGRYGVARSSFIFKKYKTSNSKKNVPKYVLLKKIAAKIVKNNVDWEVLQGLQHPNVARYILVYERMTIFLSTTVYIVQDYCQFTVLDFTENITKISGEEVLKNAVLQIALGLQYLHGNGIVHKNLKPTNILVKPPLGNPKAYILTDFGYTDYKNYPQEHILSCFKNRIVPDNPDITDWMAPELLEEQPLETFKGDLGVNLEAVITPHCEGTRSDIYSFGKILDTIFQKVAKKDKVDKILRKLLVKQMMVRNPIDRITCDGILDRHPYLVVQPRGNTLGRANSRIDYIKELYDRLKARNYGMENWRKNVEYEVFCVFGTCIPWNEPKNSFGSKIFEEMDRRARKKYDANSFIDLLRLIRNLKEHPIEGNKQKQLRNEVSNDAFSKNFPCVLPLIYICMECSKSSGMLISFLSDIWSQFQNESYTEVVSHSSHRGRRGGHNQRGRGRNRPS